MNDLAEYLMYGSSLAKGLDAPNQAATMVGSLASAYAFSPRPLGSSADALISFQRSTASKVRGGEYATFPTVYELSHVHTWKMTSRSLLSFSEGSDQTVDDRGTARPTFNRLRRFASPGGNQLFLSNLDFVVAIQDTNLTTGLPKRAVVFCQVILPETEAAPTYGDASREESLSFVTALYKKLKETDEDLAIRFVIKFLYELRKNGRFALCDRILQDVQIEKIPAVAMVALLTISAPIKDKLPHRADFYGRAKRAIIQQRGPEATERLLIGLD